MTVKELQTSLAKLDDQNAFVSVVTKSKYGSIVSTADVDCVKSSLTHPNMVPAGHVILGLSVS